MKINPNSAEFKKILQEETLKFKKIISLEREKEKLEKFLNENYEDECCGMEESLNESEQLLGGSKEQLEKEMQDIIIPLWIKKNGYKLTSAMYNAEMQNAAADNYLGKWGTDPTTRAVIYRPESRINREVGFTGQNNLPGSGS